MVWFLKKIGALPAKAMDVFAGSGSLGVEALSRGAVLTAFVDFSPARAAAVLVLSGPHATAFAKFYHLLSLSLRAKN